MLHFKRWVLDRAEESIDVHPMHFLLNCDDPLSIGVPIVPLRDEVKRSCGSLVREIELLTCESNRRSADAGVGAGNQHVSPANFQNSFTARHSAKVEGRSFVSFESGWLTISVVTGDALEKGKSWLQVSKQVHSTRGSGYRRDRLGCVSNRFYTRWNLRCTIGMCPCTRSSADALQNRFVCRCMQFLRLENLAMSAQLNLEIWKCACICRCIWKFGNTCVGVAENLETYICECIWKYENVYLVQLCVSLNLGI